MKKKTHQCLEIIRVAKERQASEANKAASILLEQEKTREESKKAAAARKKEKKKKKKEERKAEKQSKAPEDGDANTEDKKEKTLEIIAEDDSGINANSQGSGSSNDKDEAGFIEPPGKKRGRGSAAKQAAEAVLTENKTAENKGKGGVGGAFGLV